MAHTWRCWQHPPALLLAVPGHVGKAEEQKTVLHYRARWGGTNSPINAAEIL